MKRLFGLEKKQESETGVNSGTGTGGEAQQGIRGLSCLYSPQRTEVAHVRDIVDILSDMGKLAPEKVEQIRAEASSRRGADVEQILVAGKYVTPEDVLIAKAELLGYQFKNITPEDVDRKAFDKLGLQYVRANKIVPVAVRDHLLVVATTEPTNVFALDDVKRQTGMSLEVMVCHQKDIDAVCDEFDESKLGYDVDEIMNDMADIEVVKDVEEDAEDLEKSAGESPVIKFANYLISNAVREGASDIHIEPKEKYTKIRYRIDGILFESMQAPAKMHPAIVSRIKIMANLDISERRVPQDGKIAVLMGGRGVDLRISILPTSHGEKVVIRILDSKSISYGLEETGMESDILASFREQISMPHGILLVTGPTGSGKSTTLYSALKQMDSEALNVSTVEDPVEYDLEYCNQVQVNEKVGMTFAAALRSLLRQDPDIVMVGEIRDHETSRIAVQAALTGHLVLSTLHTNDAPSTISRMVNIGIEPYLIAASLNGILAQRLVRRVCPHCQETYSAPDKIRGYLEKIGADPDNLICGKGCDKCRESGYSGRAGIHELLVVDEEFRDRINKDASVESMRRAFVKAGNDTMFDDGLKKVARGITTVEEVLRVTEIYGKNEDEVFVENLS
ncbi:Type II traffic warden ATPase [Anaerohalosphaera lusitana]|uniref:Type II traffic warden ATPase n=1 Tax=Anaerohalosphaera lusitana TaxID=1936003 RepID=A0A1U9NNS6_9BACT|nr:ATPase, T2SS/T4P/T4SS family [Anaerohalosphaera lusitana]AQT69571.1 Type II traffic warden ATPase [Anaerohalosphaera lusitana]